MELSLGVVVRGRRGGADIEATEMVEEKVVTH
jgi:hypothetical protein